MQYFQMKAQILKVLQILKFLKLSQKHTNSKKEKILPLGLTDNAILKKDISKDEIIKLDDVNLDLPEEVIEARNYQYNLIK